MTHFTIIIPTRERLETLRWCLKTCLDQSYPEFRIIVSDNASQDGTSDYLKSVVDDRLEVVQTPRRVSMSENYEFVLDYALKSSPSDSYVTVLGDDDGLMPEALSYWDKVISENPNCSAFTWPLCYYAWPSCLNTSIPNVLNCPLDKKVRQLDIEELRSGISTFSIPYSAVARVYYGLVHADILRSLIRGGRYIHSLVPDVYLGCAVTFCVDNLVSAPYPLSIVGASKHSTGQLQISGGENRDKKSTNDWFQNEENLPPHPSVGVFPSSLRLCEIEVLSQLRDQGFPIPAISGEDFLSAAIAELDSMSSAKQIETRSAIESVSKRNNWSDLFSQHAGKIDLDQSVPPQPDRLQEPIILEPVTPSIIVDGFAYSVSNVSDASMLAGTLMGFGHPDSGLGYRLLDATKEASQNKITQERLEKALQKNRELKKEAKALAKTLKTAAKALRRALEKLYQSRRWQTSRFLASPTRWASRARDSRLDAAATALDEAFDSANRMSGQGPADETTKGEPDAN